MPFIPFILQWGLVARRAGHSELVTQSSGCFVGVQTLAAYRERGGLSALPAWSRFWSLFSCSHRKPP